MDLSALRRRWPGLVGTGFLVVTTGLWTFWGVAEMYHEGWGLPFPQPLAYLIPGACCLLLTLMALTWPRAGGLLLIGIGVAFTAWWWALLLRRGGDWMTVVLTTFAVSGLLVVAGALLWIEGSRRKRGVIPARGTGFLSRYGRYVVAVAVPVAVIVVVSAARLPVVLGRYDSGQRGAAAIEAEGATLVWAPRGPGWNWRQEGGWYPSWDHLALYGAAPVGLELDAKRAGPDAHATSEDMARTGLCRFLDEDGLGLAEAPQDVWRLPTAEEVARSLVRGGEVAGCRWRPGMKRARCAVEPGKESPLWAPDEPPIYYWTATERDAEGAFYVCYNGWVQAQPKDWGNPRHGYRCVKEAR
jgi:hypothetical protein